MFFAYLDPFTGSLILQILATGFLGVLAFFKPIVNLFKGSKSKTDKALDDWNDAEENVSETAGPGDQESAK
ncbi:MAG: hypothetical protein IJD43_02505 [Thermoguttaceae bacterium]|nr:hypothetical protein [Planctomycetaceae bacterium]MBQ4142324.1 hypothetical protein [Thermoguttaceae bacterium]